MPNNVAEKMMKREVKGLALVAWMVAITACGGGADPVAEGGDGLAEAPGDLATAPQAPTIQPGVMDSTSTAAGTMSGATAGGESGGLPIEEPAVPTQPAATAEADDTPAPPPPPPPPPAGPEADEPRTVYAGVYNREQAARGNQIQERECGACHNPEDWGAGQILGAYTGQSVHSLISHIQATMPLDGPGRLSWNEYTDIVAFILQLNDVPAGEEEMGPDEESLKAIRVEYRR